jgi:hypothetical protein
LTFFFLCYHQKKKKQKEKSPLFDNLLKSTGHLSHATTSRSLNIQKNDHYVAHFTGCLPDPTLINSFDFYADFQNAGL